MFKKPNIESAKYNIEHYKIDNGLEVILIPNKRVPAVMHMLWYYVGGMNEKLGKTGLAHYLEHLLFHGTVKYPKDYLDDFVSSIGGSHNAFTSYDFTAYYQTIPKKYLEDVMDIEADRMRNIVLEPEQTIIERKIVLEERLMRRDNAPRAVLSEKLRESIFGKNNPYGRPLIGYEDDIANLTYDDALEFYNKYYYPNNAVLVIAGDIDINNVKNLVTKYYAPIKTGGTKAFHKVKEVTHVKNKLVTHEDKNSSNLEISVVYLAPSALSKENNHVYSLAISSYLLAEHKNSILFKRLVTEEDIALSISSNYSDLSRGQTFFEISVIAKDVAYKERIIQIINEELVKLKTARIKSDELERAKSLFLIESLYSKESYKSLAYIIGMNYVTGVSLENILNWDKNISLVKSKDINKAAKFVFKDENKAIGLLIPKGEDNGKE
jgi:zinc protease